MKKIGLFGGTFNPAHIAHLRAALEVREALGLDRIEFIPSARPPHKARAPMLPFLLRVRLLELAVDGCPGLRINLMEAERQGPSYTFDTLTQYRRRSPKADLYFLMGAGDLFNLPLWRRGMELGSLASLVVMSRQGRQFPEISAFVTMHSKSLGVGPLDASQRAWPLAEGRRIVHVDIPRLDISASDIRQRWRQGRSLAFLTPRAVERELCAQKEAVSAAWGDFESEPSSFSG